MTESSQGTAVVVAVGTQDSRNAIRLAAKEAQFRGAPLIAVAAYNTNPVLGAPAARPVGSYHSSGDKQRTAESALHHAIVDALGDQAGGVEQRTIPGPAGRSLVVTANAVNAGLLVLTSGGTSSALPGSMNQYVLRKAPCPVLLVPDASQAA
ncbi:MAG TPA: universal stress protein [Trebonia sp.]|nr:universal stress protein [Trebonia sp.]